MSYRKTGSRAYEDALQRISGLKAIDPELDLGNGITVVSYQQAIDDTKNAIEAYNTTLSQADTLQNQTKAKEKALRDISERILAGVAAKYGKDSDEYEKAGGTKKSDRKRRRRAPVSTTTEMV